jgi:spore coat polysaccharide biosynthesis predicted glycosyltransferase SpsG
MRARALAQHLAMNVAMSVRGGRAAARTAKSLGLPVTGTAASIKRADLIVVDDPSFEKGRSWIERARRAGVPTVSVHDCLNAHDADLVICGSIGIDAVRTSGTVLNGPQFYLLDRRISEAVHRRWDRTDGGPLRILVALGGGQHVRRIAQRLVLAIRRHTKPVSISVAAGFSRGSRPTLRGARWLAARRGLVEALAQCDIAIVAGGVTLYEACALGTPAVALAVVRAQRRAIVEFAKRGAVIDGGLASESAIERVARQVARLAGDERRRRATAKRARRLVDGLGAQRAAEHIRVMLARGGRRIA